MARHQSPIEIKPKEERYKRFNFSELTKKPFVDRSKQPSPKHFVNPEFEVAIDQLSHAERGFRREESTIVGFGPGMIGPLLGNTGRRGKSIRV